MFGSSQCEHENQQTHHSPHVCSSIEKKNMFYDLQDICQIEHESLDSRFLDSWRLLLVSDVSRLIRKCQKMTTNTRQQ